MRARRRHRVPLRLRGRAAGVRLDGDGRRRRTGAGDHRAGAAAHGADRHRPGPRARPGQGGDQTVRRRGAHRRGAGRAAALRAAEAAARRRRRRDPVGAEHPGGVHGHVDRHRARAACKGVGVVELLVRAIGTLRERHPLCFGAYQDDGGVLVPEGAHVAVTVDAGNGLYLPVVRDVAALSLEQIAAALAAMREAARAGTLRAEDLAGANIGLSVTNYADVVLTQPIIPPGMTCMLSLAGTQRTDRFALGIAHDHRVVNGRDAVIVLRDVKRVLETGVT
ncbi:2-oxo acid dehydrogenase subunit E2 [Dactylosporangium darangshiense]|uniref:2-oxo acid dehydrogenase subunit E2 n=1 Tax=Dactylosporangium darangshiense TaxID=579108 RepID=UPI003640E232